MDPQGTTLHVSECFGVCLCVCVCGTQGVEGILQTVIEKLTPGMNRNVGARVCLCVP